MTPRVWLAAHGLGRPLAMGWTSCVVLGMLAPMIAIRVQVLSNVSVDDLAWSVAILAACVSWVLTSMLLQERLPVMTATAARWPWPARLIALSVAWGLSCWPVLWTVVGAPHHVVVPTIMLGSAIVGSAALIARWAPRWVLLPALLVVMMAVMPGVVPLSVHPFRPSLRPTGVMRVQAAVLFLGSLAYLVPPGRRRCQ